MGLSMRITQHSHAAVGSRPCAIQVELDDEMFVIAVQAEAVRE